MKRAIKNRLIVGICPALFSYLSYAFFEINLNLFQWSKTARIFSFVSWVGFTAIAILVVPDVPESEVKK